VKTVIKPVERSILESSDRPPKYPKQQKQGLLFQGISPGTTFVAMATCTRTATLFLVFSLTGIHYFQPQNPNFDPLDPKFVPKVCLYIYELKKAIKTL